MRKTAKPRRGATKKKPAKKTGRTSVKSAAKKTGARAARPGTAAKKTGARAARPGTAAKKKKAPATRGVVLGMAPEPTRASLAMPAAAAAPGTCLSLDDAATIVLTAAGNPPGGLDVTLEDAHLITDLLRQRFQQRVLDAVRAKGCALDLDAIPDDADTTLGEVADVVQAQAL